MNLAFKISRVQGGKQRLKIKIHTRIRNKGRVNKVFDTGIDLPNEDAFMFGANRLKKTAYKMRDLYEEHDVKLNHILDNYTEHFDSFRDGNIDYDTFQKLLHGGERKGNARTFIENHPYMHQGKRSDNWKRYKYMFNKWEECFEKKADFEDFTQDNVQVFYHFLREQFKEKPQSARQYWNQIKRATAQMVYEKKIDMLMFPPDSSFPIVKRAEKLNAFDFSLWVKGLELATDKKHFGGLLFHLLRFSLGGLDLADTFYIDDDRIIGEDQSEIVDADNFIKLTSYFYKTTGELRNYWVKYTRQKTKNTEMVVVRINISNPTTLEIINQWNHLNIKKDSPYLVKFMEEYPDGVKTKAERAQGKWFSGQYSFGEGLRQLNRKLGLRVDTTYTLAQRTARHYSTTQLAEIDIPTDVIERINGHKSDRAHNFYKGWTPKVAEAQDKALFDALQHARIADFLELWKEKASQYIDIAEPWGV